MLIALRHHLRSTLTGFCLFVLVIVTLFHSRERNAAAQPRSAIDYRGTLLVQMRVVDLDKAIAFYRDVLGFDLILRSDALQWAELTFGASNIKLGLGAGAEVKGSGSVSLNIGVRKIEAAREILEQRGVRFTGPTITIPEKVRLADFADPDGNRIRLAESLSASGD